MATYKLIKKTIESKTEVKKFYNLLEKWAKEHSLKLDEISSYEGSLEGKFINFKEKRTYSKEIRKGVKHSYTLTISIKSSGNESTIKIEVEAKLDDNLKEPEISSINLWFLKFVNKFIKEYDPRKVDEFEKTLDHLEEILNSSHS
ncbi:MAG: hypothetical protein QXD62_00920 [Candidatus Woesearchaeota archaeon]